MVYDFDIEFLQESITEYDVVILVTSGFYEKDINGEYKHWIMLMQLKVMIIVRVIRKY